MDKQELQKLRDLPIEGVAERLGLRVERHKSLCPFHDDHHASMTFKNNKFKCWSCGESGDSISLVQKVLGKSFLEACRWLANENNVILTEYKPSEEKPPKPFDSSRFEKYFERPWLNEEAKLFLFTERRLDPRVVRWCRLTSWKDRRGVPWLQIPYFDRDGRLVGVQNRNLLSSPLGELEGAPRFRFPQGSECGIYNLPVLNRLQAGDELYITEGCSDCWAMLSAGHKAIAIPSATLLSKKDVELLTGLGSSPEGEDGRGLSFHMYPDRDAPGERLFLQLQKVLPSLVHHQLPPDCKDVADLYIKMKK